MHTRLQEIIQYKTGGRQTEFATLMGWTPQYLAKLLRGDNFGIKPVVRLLQSLPEISARWLLLGEGEMLEVGRMFSLQREAMSHVQAILELEKYLPYMSPTELGVYEQAVTTGRKPVFSPDTVSRWREQANEREQEKAAKIAAAINKSEELCRQRTVRK